MPGYNYIYARGQELAGRKVSDYSLVAVYREPYKIYKVAYYLLAIFPLSRV